MELVLVPHLREQLLAQLELRLRQLLLVDCLQITAQSLNLAEQPATEHQFFLTLSRL
jgi:hypothetical protein